MGTLLAEKVVQPAIQHAHVASCPSMDLVALATVDEKVHIFRFSGQEVFCISERHAVGATVSIVWKPDGLPIAGVVNRLGSLRTNVNNSRTGKVVHRIDCSKFSESSISCSGWATHLIALEEPESELQTLQSRVAVHNEEDQNLGSDGFRSFSNLPQELASLTVEDMLPKLSPLPSGGMDDDIFSSRVSLDTIFRSSDTKDAHRADVLILGFENACVLVTMYDFFDVGLFSIKPAFVDLDTCCPIRHCFHPMSTTHSLLIRGSSRFGASLSLLPVDLRLLPNAKKYLPILASTATQLRYLLRYVKQIQVQLYGDLKTALDVPRRFMANVEDSLSESGEWNWTQAAYHLVMTGNSPPEVREWLVNQLGEWGHKRWDKAVLTGYENARRLAQENFLPALERLMVVASRLRGLSRYPNSNRHLGLSTRQLDNIIDTTSSLQLLAHQILIVCTSERQQFQAFSSWLRQEIDKQASETENREDGNATKVNVPMVLRYINHAMLHSDLLQFVDLGQPSQRPASLHAEAHEGATFKLYTEMITRKHGLGIETRQTPYLDALIKHLESQCTKLFEGVTETQRKGIRFGSPLSLAQGTFEHIDLQLSPKANISDSGTKRFGPSTYESAQPVLQKEFVQYVALARASSHSVDVYRIPLVIENGMSSYDKVECARIALGGHSLCDVRFVGEQEILLAVSWNGTSRLVSVPLEKDFSATGDGLEYRFKGGSEPLVALDISTVEAIRPYTWMELPEGISWTPQKLEIGRRKGRPLVCVVAQDNFHYRIYDFNERGRDKAAAMDMMKE